MLRYTCFHNVSPGVAVYKDNYRLVTKCRIHLYVACQAPNNYFVSLLYNYEAPEATFALLGLLLLFFLH